MTSSTTYPWTVRSLFVPPAQAPAEITFANGSARRYLLSMLAHQPTPSEIEAAADEAADDDAMAEYQAKGGISHRAMRAWILSWGTSEELPRPQIGD